MSWSSNMDGREEIYSEFWWGNILENYNLEY